MPSGTAEVPYSVGRFTPQAHGDLVKAIEDDAGCLDMRPERLRDTVYSPGTSPGGDWASDSGGFVVERRM